jgi:energy-coupling factor transporter ATP-binding protein EcfA2
MTGFKKAVKYEAKGRVAFIGPAGSGKSYTALKLARALAGPTGKIAAADTEHGSLSKYADLFDFDVCELSSYSPTAFIGTLREAEKGGYSVFITDSLSHFWVGKDGALEFVDMAAKRYKDNMGGWKEFRPHEREMVDAMISSPMHIIVTMRTKTEYVEDVNQHTGKKMRRKVGLAPVQREGLEYEFDLVAYMDDENTMIVDKTRCSAYSGKALTRPGEKEFSAFIDWLKGAPLDRNKAPLPLAEDEGSAYAQERLKQQKLAAVPQPIRQKYEHPQIDDSDIPAELGGTHVSSPAPDRAEQARQRTAKKQKPEMTFAEKCEVFSGLRTDFQFFNSEREYYEILQDHGFEHANEAVKAGTEKARAVYNDMRLRLDLRQSLAQHSANANEPVLDAD